MHFEVTPAIFEQFPEVKIGLVVATNINNTGVRVELERRLERAQTAVRETLAGTASQHPHVAAWREAYRAFGVKAKQHPSSLENLLKRTLKGDALPSINPLVDLYNVVSLEHLVPVGGEDLAALSGDVRLRFAAEDEPAVTLLGEREPRAPKPGEVIYADDEGAICRRWNWKEVERSKLTPDTTRALLVVEALPPVGEAQLRAALAELSALAQHFCGAQTQAHVLNRVHASVQLV